MAELNFETIERPYDSLLQRSGQTPVDGTPNKATTPATTLTPSGGSSGGNGNVESQPVKESGSFGDLWIKNFIRSQNWKPKTVGFSLEGETGYFECSNVFISGHIQALTGQVGGFTIGATDLSAEADGNKTILSSGVTALSAGPTGAPLLTITQDGVLTASSVVITGGLIGGSVVSNVGYVSSATADTVPSDLSVASTTTTVGADGTVTASVVLTWTAISSTTFDHYQIRYKKDANVYYTYLDAKTNTITIEGLVPNISYNFGIASVNKF